VLYWWQQQQQRGSLGLLACRSCHSTTYTGSCRQAPQQSRSIAAAMSSKGKGKAAGVDNTARRTWDKEEFAEKAAKREAEAAAADDEDSALAIKKRKRLERDPLHQGLIVARSNLQKRDYAVNLSDRLGKTQVIGLNTPLNQQAGYYCSVCDCVLRDSQSYLDHINGKYHNRALGMSMKVEKSSVEQVGVGSGRIMRCSSMHPRASSW
jgi:hypothetical protein